MEWCKKSLGWWTVSGLLLGIGFVFPLLWTLGFIGGGIFIWRSVDDSSRLALIGGWWAWTLKYALANIHIFTTYPIEWLTVKISAPTQWLLIGLYWSTTALWLGVGGVVVVMAVWLYRKSFQEIAAYWIGILLLPAWVLGEVVGSLVFSLALHGPGGSVNAAYSLGYSGYLLGEHGVLVQVARFGGVYSLGALFIVLATGVYLFRQRRGVVIGVLSVLSVSSVLYTVAAPDVVGQTRSVGVVDTAFDRGALDTVAGDEVVAQELAKAVSAALASELDYLLLPEGANYLQHEEFVQQGVLRFKRNFPGAQTVLIDSGSTRYGEQSVLEAVVVDSLANQSEVVHKRYLVPQGEFMPTMYAALIRALGSKSFLQYVESRIKMEVGPRINQRVLSERMPGILFCFESVSPTGVRTILNEKPVLPFVAHPISHRWFHEPVTWWHQMDTMLRVQALWNNVYIVSAGNYAVGKTYAPNGAVVPMETVATGEGWVVKRVQLPK